MRFSASAIAALACTLELLTAGGVALAQGQQTPGRVPGIEMPSDDAIRKAQQTVLDSLNKGRAGAPAGANGYSLPTDQEVGNVIGLQRKGLVDSGVLTEKGVMRSVDIVPSGTYKTELPQAPDAAATKKDDLNDLVERFSNNLHGKVPPEVAKADPNGALRIFVSFSMPPKLLAEYSRQAKELDAVLVIRGFKDNNMMKTKSAARAVNPSGAAWEINPNLFTAFKVEQVPTIVMAGVNAATLDEQGCAPDTSYASVSGEVSIELALNLMKEKAATGIAQLAAFRLNELKAKKEPARYR